MEQSLEAMWKEGFLDDDALVAPTLNDLYNKKSIHIIDKFKRMFRTNLNAIFIGSFLLLGVSFLIKIPILGIGYFIILNTIAIVNNKMFKSVNEIDNSVSSYQYIKAFDSWLKHKRLVNMRMAAYYYPAFFLSTILGFWYGNTPYMISGQDVVHYLLTHFPDTEMYFGFPLIVIQIVSVISVLLLIVGGRIYEWDVNMVYGRVFNKLDQLLFEMEELRK